jgi:protein-S-isoprenylcysteine O-methyltransferase Ste14
MAPKAPAKRYVIHGAFFQLPMILLWGVRMSIPYMERGIEWETLMQFSAHELMSPGFIVQMAGLGLMSVSMMRIYRHASRDGKALITSDVFAITRHPMYHGMFLADASVFFLADLANPWFWVSWALFAFLMLMAGWYQEKETLVRWGSEAEAYYRRTPRFVFEWLWFWAYRRRTA